MKISLTTPGARTGRRRNFIREAMELFRNQRIRPRTSVAALKPLNLGKTLRPLTNRDDLLGEMLNDPRH